MNLVADFATTLALKVAVGDTTATLSSATDDDGVALPTGTYGLTIDRKNSSKEYIECTLTGTALTNVKTVTRGTGVASTGFANIHRKGAEVIISDFVVIKRFQDIFETGYPSAQTPSSDYMLATKKYVDDLALGGATTVDKITISAIAGETVAAGNLLYLKEADAKWWKADADTLATVKNAQLGIAQGSGTAGNAITNGVLVKGVDSNQTGLSTHTLYYASNTAGGISSSAGTNTKVVGVSHPSDTTKLYFNPEYYINALTVPEVTGIDVQSFTANGTWTKPTGVFSNSVTKIELWGGGAGGATGPGGGGGGGGYSVIELPTSSLAATAAVAVGTPGASGSDGGNSTFGSYLTAYGGGKGANPVTAAGAGLGGKVLGGGGGGGGAAGSTGGANGGGFGGGIGATSTSGTTDATQPFGGGGGGSSSGSSTGGASFYGGGGGGNGTNFSFPGGASVFGGGGGGGGTGATAAAGGLSTYGGAGGTGGIMGHIPGGGGGRGATGATGQARITTFY